MNDLFCRSHSPDMQWNADLRSEKRFVLNFAKILLSITRLPFSEHICNKAPPVDMDDMETMATGMVVM